MLRPLFPPLAGALAVAFVLATAGPLAPARPAAAAAALRQQGDVDDLRAQEQEALEQLEGVEQQRESIEAELEGARAEREAAQVRLDAAVAHLDALDAGRTEVEAQAAGVRAEIEGLIAASETARARLGAQVRDLYMRGAEPPVAGLFEVAYVQDIGIRSHYLAAMTRDQRADIERYGTVEVQLERRRTDLRGLDAELAALEQEAAVAQASLERELLLAAGAEQAVVDELAAADAEAHRLQAAAVEARRAADEAEEAERAAAEAAARAAEEAARLAEEEAERARIAALPPPPPPAFAQAPTSSGDDGAFPAPPPPADPAATPAAPSGGAGMACPQDHPRSFTDTWGAPRSGGRTHKGTDIFGTRGGNVFAITSGSVTRTSNGSTSGLFLALAGDDGHTYWYMHLQDFVASAGQRVSAGQLIAHNGDTGNARGTTPHIHFEYHPGGGGPANPYSLLRSVCG